MRVIFTAVPVFGHLLPLLPLARAARAAGSDVLVATHESFRAAVGDLPFAAVGPSQAEALLENTRRFGTDGTDVADLSSEAGIFTATLPDLTYRDLLTTVEHFAPDLSSPTSSTSPLL